MVYFYENSEEKGEKLPVRGIAHLKWSVKHSAATVNKMEGVYFGYLSNDE